MEKLSPLKQPHGAALTRQFAVLSLLVISVITAALCAIIAHYLQKNLLEREWMITASYVHSEALDHLTPGDFIAPQEATAQARFTAFYQQTVTMPEIVRVKIYDASFTVVWSDEPQLLGRRFADNPQLLGAMTGQTMVNLETHERKGENVFEGPEFSELVEVYVPIRFPDSAGVVGVVETYKAPRAVFANIRQGQAMVVKAALGGSALLYLTLFWIVRRAARRIDEQHRTLAAQRHDLATTNDELRAVQQQLLAAERMAAIGEVVTVVAHGIRNPLANIRAVAQVAALECQNALESSPMKRHVRHIMSEVDRLDGRLKELLQFVRPATQQREPVNVNAVVQSALQMLAGRLAQTALKVEAHFSPILPPVLGDALLVEQILLSLIGNAIEAMPTGEGTITVTTEVEPDSAGTVQVSASIRDTGVGIADEDMTNIFIPFFTTKAQGTGLGLAIAKKFAEAYGGVITIQSQPGQGTTCRVAFPAHTAR